MNDITGNNFYDQNNSTAYADPFSGKTISEEPDLTFRKGKRPFEEVMKESFLSIFSVIGSVILFCLFLEMFFREFFPHGSFYFSITSLSAMIIILGIFLYFGAFLVKNIIRAVKTTDTVDNFNSLVFLGAQLMIFGIAKLTYLGTTPSKILFAVLMAGVILAAVFGIKKLHEDDKRFFQIGLIVLIVVLGFFLTFRVFSVTALYNGKDIQTETFCFQSKSTNNFEQSAHAVQSDLFKSDDFEYDYGIGIIRNRLVSTKEELDSFFTDELHSLTAARPDETRNHAILQLMKDTIQPNFKKYDEAFFETHSIAVFEMGYFNNPKNVEVDAIYTKASDHSLNVHVNTYLSSGTNDNDGNCIIVMAVPKAYEYMFRYDYLFFQENEIR